ncbi:FkbM family methyltransferase [Marinimicrobium koreense]|uniref:FkbM family methyltransferase n=1 Tax=Marinimicrobium koreense TaxID=306545 RepID=A0A3N1NYG7_9GAMM|nr:hypothetical protein [Marinimicrobium koreense]ROQ20037.1 FkbM family methyltransferase [Marinimicrobium koreense]
MPKFPHILSTILHMGAGNANELPEYLNSNAKRILLVEPNPKLAESLRRRTADDARVEVLEVAVSDDPQRNLLTEYNIPEAASLYKPDGLYKLFPGLRSIVQHSVEVRHPAALVADTLPADEPNLLVIQAPGAEQAIIEALAAESLLERISQLAVTSSDEPHYTSGSAAPAVLNALKGSGFEVAEEDRSNLDWPQWHLTFDARAHKIKALEAALNEKQAQTEAIRQQLSAKEVELSGLAEELTARESKIRSLDEQLSQAERGNGEYKQRIETTQQQLSAKENELKGLKEELAARDSTIKSQDDRLSQAEDTARQLEDELRQKKDRVKSLKVELEERATQIKQQEQKLNETSAKQSNLTERLQQHEKTINTQEEQLDRAQKAQVTAEQKATDLANRVQALEQQLKAQHAAQQQSDKLLQRMEYLFEQQSLQLEQAANALGRHVSVTAKTTAKELEAGIQLQQQYGSQMIGLEEQGKRLPSTVALQLSRLLKSQPYDVVIEMGSGVTTSFLAHTLRSRPQEGGSKASANTDVAHYIDPSDEDLPKRIVCFEHSRARFNHLQSTLKQSGLAPVVNLHFAPLVPYQHQGTEYLYYDCANRLQQLANLFENRQARIFVLLNESAEEQQPDRVAALPQLLQYLSAHTLDVVVNDVDKHAELIDQWQALLNTRGLECQPAVEFGAPTAQRLTINP